MNPIAELSFPITASLFFFKIFYHYKKLKLEKGETFEGIASLISGLARFDSDFIIASSIIPAMSGRHPDLKMLNRKANKFLIFGILSALISIFLIASGKG